MEKITCPFYTNSMLYPNRIAFYDSQHSINFQQADARIGRMAEWLVSVGAKNGHRIALLSRNSIDYAIAVFALSRLGASSVLLHLRLTEKDCKDQLALSRCQMILSDQDHYEQAKALGLPVYILEDGARILAEGKREKADGQGSESVPLDKEASVLFTSGSKGIPKGVILTNGNFYYSAVASNANLKLTGGDCWLLSLPLYHVGGLSILHRCALAGASVYVTHGLDCGQISSLIDASRITHLSLVPTMLQRLIESRVGAPMPDTVKVILLGGAPTPKKMIEKIRESGLPVLTTYGMTESASQIASMSPDDPADKLSTSGKPLKYVELQIVNSEAKEVPPGTEGEIIVKGETVFGGYLNLDAGAKRSDDQWFFTGDKGYLDSDGYLTVTGRVDDMFVSGGENIYPGEIEVEAASCPNIRACAVIAVDDAQWGERPVLFIEPAQKVTLKEQDVAAYLKARLPKIKMPNKIISRDRLPRTSIGKIDYAALKELYRKRYSS